MADRKDDDVFEVNGPNGRSRTNQDRTEAFGGTLQSAGFSEGDRIISNVRFSFPTTVTTTSTSFSNIVEAGAKGLTSLSGIPSGASVDARLAVGSGPTMNSDGEYRASITQDGQSLSPTPAATVDSGDTFAATESGTVSVPPDGLTEFTIQFRSVGGGEVSIFRATVVLEVVL